MRDSEACVELDKVKIEDRVEASLIDQNLPIIDGALVILPSNGF